MGSTTDDPAEKVADLQSKLYESQALAKSLQIQLDDARSELIDTRAELKLYTASRVEAHV